jgi:starvation-inducible DNA-binding protein
MKLNSIGLSAEKSDALSKELNNLLANFQQYYQNLRGIHWNIKGKRFFELHPKFEELYDDANIKVDAIAERVLTLGGVPLHTFMDYTAHAKVPVGKNVTRDGMPYALSWTRWGYSWSLNAGSLMPQTMPRTKGPMP